MESRYAKADNTSIALTEKPDDDVMTALNDAQNTLVLGVNQWRNAMMLNAGWLGVTQNIMLPAYFFEGLLYELKIAPTNFVTKLSKPFISEYLHSKKESKLTQVLTSWTLQLFVLLLLIVVLIKQRQIRLVGYLIFSKAL